ncbi:MAG TPA: DUF3891 family protein [Actinomycetota bacterium]
MIIRRDGQGLLAVAQPDHARMAGIFAESWRDGAGPSLVAASHRHDDGWIDWEKAPTIDDRGRPHSFLTIPMDDRVAVYRRGIDLLATTDPAAGLLTSLHFGRLLAQGLGAAEGKARRTAEGFLAERSTWEAQTRRQLGEPEGIEADYAVLRAVDSLSLLLCMRPLDELDAASVMTMTLRVEGQRVILDPYPFEAGELTVTVAARALPTTTFDDDEAYRSALASAPVRELNWTLSRPRR